MSEHIEGCDGTKCDDYECGLCAACLFDSGDPRGLSDVESLVKRRTVRLCEICYSTRAGNLASAPGSEGSPALMQLVAYVGNMIFERLGRELAVVLEKQVDFERDLASFARKLSGEDTELLRADSALLDALLARGICIAPSVGSEWDIESVTVYTRAEIREVLGEEK